LGMDIELVSMLGRGWRWNGDGGLWTVYEERGLFLWLFVILRPWSYFLCNCYELS
ncbi:hypothetical protein NEUTE2DRAFT_45491, partial [Neurospora tetrasperma FGSC 2509]